MFGIVGLGAVGSLIVYFLNRAGVVPRAVVRKRCERPLFCIGDDCTSLAVETTSDLGGVKYVFLAVKAYDTASTISLLKGVVLVVQNGVGGFELVKERYGSAYPVVLTYGVYREGCVTQLRGLGEFIMPIEAADAAEVLERGGARVKVVDDVEPYRWLKLAVNAAINSLTAVLNKPNRVVVEVPYVKELAALAALEVAELCRKMGVKLPADPVEEVYRVAEATALNISSTARDIATCSPTEIDYINGAVVKYGERFGVETPVNKTLYLLVKALEAACGRGF
ncbi:MAG: ketopantoate reductase family protein [Pyrobaculum sp.]|jgi:2-dehydropantoate 2-reductase